MLIKNKKNVLYNFMEFIVSNKLDIPDNLWSNLYWAILKENVIIYNEYIINNRSILYR